MDSHRKEPDDATRIWRRYKATGDRALRDRLVLTYAVFARGRWRNIKVSLHDPAKASEAGPAIDTPEATQDAARGA